jgi:hypothetical protein
MITPVSPSILDDHPGFVKLHKQLVESKLDPDGSTRQASEQYMKTGEKLEASRTEAAKEELLLSHLRRLYRPDDQLPPALQHLLSIAVEYMCSSHSLTDEEIELLQEDIHLFKAKMPETVDALSHSLRAQHTELITMVSLTNEGLQYGRRDANAMGKSSDLNVILQNQIDKANELRHRTLPTSLIDAANALSTLLAAQSVEVQRRIRSLEQNKHGSQSRHVQARVGFLSAVAQGLEGKVKTEFLEQKRDLYSPEMVRKLERRMEDMDAEERGLRERRHRLENALAEYEDADDNQRSGSVLLRLGKRYGEIEDEIRSVRADVERLQRGDERVI